MLKEVVNKADSWIGDITEIKPTEDIEHFLLRLRTLKSLTEVTAFLVEVKDDIEKDRFDSQCFIEDLEDLENELHDIWGNESE